MKGLFHDALVGFTETITNKLMVSLLLGGTEIPILEVLIIKGGKDGGKVDGVGASGGGADAPSDLLERFN